MSRENIIEWVKLSDISESLKDEILHEFYISDEKIEELTKELEKYEYERKN